jgi:hypothetical protein
MSPRSRLWFQDERQRGVAVATAFVAAEMIDGWTTFWKHEISDENLEAMTRFALACPEAALHRWSIMAGPRPWIPEETLMSELAVNPKYSLNDYLECQRKNP